MYHTTFLSRWSFPSWQRNVGVLSMLAKKYIQLYVLNILHIHIVHNRKYYTYVTWNIPHIWLDMCLSSVIIEPYTVDLNQKETVQPTYKGHKKLRDRLFHFLAQCSYSCGCEVRRPVSNIDCQLQLESMFIQFGGIGKGPMAFCLGISFDNTQINPYWDRLNIISSCPKICWASLKM